MTTVTPTRGRPRNQDLELKLLRAAQDALIEDGFEKMTVENVAERCGAGKATVYRRWATKQDLVIAAIAALYDPPTAPDTGDLRGDLVGCCQLFLREDSRSQRVLTGLAAGMAANPALRDAAAEFVGGPFRAVLSQVLSRAVERGLIEPQADTELIGQVFPAMAFHRIAVFGTSVDESFIDRVVDNVLLPALHAH